MSRKKSKAQTSKIRYENKQSQISTKPRSWTLPTVLSLLLGLVGVAGVIQLRPQVTITPLNESISGQPFSAPFKITNTGYLSLKVNYIVIVGLKIKFRGFIATNVMTGNREWNDFTMERNDSKTIVWQFMNQKPDASDFVISIDYRFLGFSCRRYFRFQGVYGDNWQWVPQPHDKIIAEIEKYTDEALKHHKKAIDRKGSPSEN